MCTSSFRSSAAPGRPGLAGPSTRCRSLVTGALFLTAVAFQTAYAQTTPPAPLPDPKIAPVPMESDRASPRVVSLGFSSVDVRFGRLSLPARLPSWRHVQIDIGRRLFASTSLEASLVAVTAGTRGALTLVSAGLVWARPCLTSLHCGVGVWLDSSPASTTRWRPVLAVRGSPVPGLDLDLFLPTRAGIRYVPWRRSPVDLGLAVAVGETAYPDLGGRDEERSMLTHVATMGPSVQGRAGRLCTVRLSAGPSLGRTWIPRDSPRVGGSGWRRGFSTTVDIALHLRRPYSIPLGTVPW